MPALSEPASEDLQGGGVLSVVVGLYDDLHVLIEGDEEAQKALHGELAEVAAAGQRQKQSQRQRTGVSAPHEQKQKQVPHRAFARFGMTKS